MIMSFSMVRGKRASANARLEAALPLEREAIAEIEAALGLPKQAGRSG